MADAEVEDDGDIGRTQCWERRQVPPCRMLVVRGVRSTAWRTSFRPAWGRASSRFGRSTPMMRGGLNAHATDRRWPGSCRRCLRPTRKRTRSVSSRTPERRGPRARAHPSRWTRWTVSRSGQSRFTREAKTRGTPQSGTGFVPKREVAGLQPRRFASCRGGHSRSLGVGRLSLITDPENLASQRVAERAGFRREGLLRAWHPTRSGRRDSVMFSLIPDDLTRSR